jgi:hypothetical protein
MPYRIRLNEAFIVSLLCLFFYYSPLLSELPMCRGVASEPAWISEIVTAPAIALAIYLFSQYPVV